MAELLRLKPCLSPFLEFQSGVRGACKGFGEIRPESPYLMLATSQVTVGLLQSLNLCPSGLCLPVPQQERATLGGQMLRSPAALHCEGGLSRAVRAPPSQEQPPLCQLTIFCFR